ncbi:MAG TPA: hypothetical protein VIQ99_09335 [Gammaproteobacteria bacterium]
MSSSPPLERNIPTLTEIIRTANPTPADVETLLAEVQTKLASRTFQLADTLLRSAFAEMEASLFEQISSRLRRELPDLIDATLREHFDTHNG